MPEKPQQNYQSPTDSAMPSGGVSAGRKAADLIRAKLSRIYAQEPEARQEMAEANAVRYRSEHQKFMYQLSASGKDLAAVQTEWHNYYQGLPAHEKHQVWQEFYDSQAAVTGQSNLAATDPQTLATHKHQAARPQALRDIRTAQDVRTAIRNKLSASGKLQTKHHIQSLLFGLSLGLIAVIIFLFGFFNEVVIAPFIQPSRTAVATPIIISSNSVPASTTPEVIIPKINVEIPVVYNETSTDEAAIQSDLQSGVVHYPTTVLPGQNGNAAFYGHSSNNIFNKGKYKFAFVLLHTLVVGDTFYLTNNNKIYVYKIISRSIVEPSEVGVLGPVSGQTATATLITCDPPGTSLKRLIVVGQQISPDPSANTAAAASSSTSAVPTVLPGNGPTLWARYLGTFLGKGSLIIIILVALLLTVRMVYQPRKIVR